MSAHLVRGEVPQAGQGGPHQLSEGGVGALPAGADSGEEGEEDQDPHDEGADVTIISHVTPSRWLDTLKVVSTRGGSFC